MAYSDFTFAKLSEKFQLKQVSNSLFMDMDMLVVQPSQRLLDDLAETRQMPLYSEKAKSEAIIFPIIRELKRNNPQISIFSGYTFNVDNTQELTGAPDFMISAQAGIVEPQSPIFCLVESKNKAPEEGFAQCAAEMYAARLFNEQMREPHRHIYGAVTNAFDWVFLKLEKNDIIVDIDRYYLNELPKILGVLQYIVNQNS